MVRSGDVALHSEEGPLQRGARGHGAVHRRRGWWWWHSGLGVVVFGALTRRLSFGHLFSDCNKKRQNSVLSK